ncbi:hypothetical protein like AT4G39880 [Hibiscus trionum]|uniref:Large ribosomal subunit protein uL23m n=1 Tax=Hibiscus trionum TaxID=183268 RepID=A0A9W7MWT1_HIBTR|nr:hypothetical protein like AT4G39880 [Hibiscus trionum]
MAGSFTDLPMKLLTPSSSSNIKEFALKTVPAASKTEIKSFLQSMFGLQVEKVRTLNMQGKKKRRGGHLIARPNYKKAYVTLKTPFVFSSDFFPVSAIEEDTKGMDKLSNVSERGEWKALQLGAKYDFSQGRT